MGGSRRASALEVLVLGDLQVRRGGRPLALPPSRKTRALLGYLAVVGRPQSRNRLCDLLWDGPGDPRGALRWSLAKLRPVLDDDRARLSANKDSVGVELAVGELDLAAVRAAVASGVRQAGLDALRCAAGRFRGELLEGLDLPDDFRFHEWCVAERERARRLRLEVLDALVEGLEGEPEEALAHARARVEVDPFAERGHLAVIRLLGKLKRRREAIDQYDACRHILSTALGARPSAELERARLEATGAAAAGARGVAVGGTSPPAPPRRRDGPPALPLEATRAAPLVGRARERAELARVAAAARGSRRCHVVLLVGEPGVGKSRLLDEAAAQVLATSGGLAVKGRSYEAEMLRPYGPWLDALRAAPLATLPEVQRAELAPLLPELGAPAAGVLDQARLFDAVVRALATLAERGLLAVLLDDAHWIDEPSAALLHYTLRALDGAPVLVVCTARPGELADNPAALRVARALARAERTARLDLGPLDAEEVRALVGRVAPDLDAARIFTESEGNPLFALEVARALRDGTETGTLEALLSERLARVAGRAREVVPWAAALGRSFPVERLLRVSGMASSELLSSVEELERRGILRPSAEGAYDFTHDLVRRAAYRALSDPRRRLLHREIARTLAPLPDADGALAGEIARHAALGDDAELAATASISAGARAVRLWALNEGDEIAVRGLRFAERLPPAERIPLAIGLFRVRVDASRRRGGDPALLPLIRSLIDEAQRAGLAAEVAAGRTVLTQAHFANRDLAHSAEESLRSLEAFREVDPAAAADAMAEVGGCLAILEREIPRARVLLEETGRLGTVRGRAAVFHAFGLGIIQELEGSPEEAAVTLERALRLASEAAPWEELQLLGRLALIDLELGQTKCASERADRMREVAARHGDEGDVLFAGAFALVTRRALGESVLEAEVEEVLARLEPDAKLRFAQVACALAEQDLAEGRVGVARARLERARAAAALVPRPSISALVTALLARAALMAGDAASASEELRAARRVVEPCAPAGRAARLLDQLARELDLHMSSAAAAPP